MPPEQALGDMEKVDNLSDIYSIGAVLYEMVSGYCLFTGKTSDEVLVALSKGPPEPVQSHVPDLPVEVVALIEKAMAPEKQRRYPSARALGEDLTNYLEGRSLNEEPQGARSRPMWERLLRLFK
jgi:serine/threonine protein kinase